MTDVLDSHELADVRPILSAYSYLVRVKNLGLTMDAADFSPQLVDDLHTVQDAIEQVNEKRRNRKGNRGG